MSLNQNISLNNTAYTDEESQLIIINQFIQKIKKLNYSSTIDSIIGMNQNINGMEKKVDELKNMNINEKIMYDDFITSAKLQSYLNYIGEKNINIFDKNNIDNNDINTIKVYLEKNKTYFSDIYRQKIHKLLIKLAINNEKDKEAS